MLFSLQWHLRDPEGSAVGVSEPVAAAAAAVAADAAIAFLLLRGVAFFAAGGLLPIGDK